MPSANWFGLFVETSAERKGYGVLQLQPLIATPNGPRCIGEIEPGERVPDDSTGPHLSLAGGEIL